MESVKAALAQHGSLCITIQPEIYDFDGEYLILHLDGVSVKLPTMGLIPNTDKQLRLILEFALAKP